MHYGLVGENLVYSFSKLIHDKIGKYEFSLISLPRDEFKAFIQKGDYMGLNVTVPYKKEALAYCDRVSDIARSIGSVNTLYWQGGDLWGTNTDYTGFLYMIDRKGISLKGKNVLILGKGGTSLTIQKAVRKRGARKIVVCGRGHDFMPDRDAEIIINTTPVGTFPNNGNKIIDLGDFPQCCGVVDVVYNPIYTNLLLRAKENGIPYAGGLSMLVAQATASAEIFTGELLQDQNEDLLRWLKHSLRNIVLIGMPGSGKSTTGQHLAKAMGRKFVDLDDAIAKDAGMPILDIFEQLGENHFRDLETKAAKEYGAKHSLVIAAGGGTVLRPENMDALRQNALVFFLDRNPELLPLQGRPLSTDRDTVRKMYEQRIALYTRHCDYTISCQDPVPENTAKILKIVGNPKS